MKTLHFTTVILSDRVHVWNTMLAPATYQLWTAEFMEGSFFEGSWETGQRIRFLAPDGRGITSVIAENHPYRFLSIKHLGFIKEGVEDTESETVRSGAPSFENYAFSDCAAGTELLVHIDVTAELEESMAQTWPKALARLKTICESR